MLKIENLKVEVDGKEILKGVNLEVQPNKVHVIMGPNGSGKSTLAQSIMGHPKYEVTEGSVEINGEDLLSLEPNERAQKGVFLSFQYPSEIPGVTISNYLRLIYNNSHNEKLTPARFRKLLCDKMALLEIPQEFSERYLNEGFSGGEKKRMEMLQMLILEPRVAILDETDSGLDIDALKIVSKAVNTLKEKTEMSVVLITHYTRVLEHIEADTVHILQSGKIVREGGSELAHELESKGYAPFDNSGENDEKEILETQ